MSRETLLPYFNLLLLKKMEWCGGKYLLNANISSVIDRISNKDCSPQTCEDLKCSTKQIYEHIHRTNFVNKLKTKSFRKLLIEGFDTEQIFQQIELQNESSLLHFNQIVNIIDDSKFAEIEREREDLGVSNSVDIGRNNLKDPKNEYVFDDDSDSSVDDVSINKLKLICDKELVSDESENSDSKIAKDDFSESEGFSDIDSKTKKTAKSNKFKSESIVDDQFFKLSNLREFLNEEDLKAENDFEDENEEEIDLFQNISDESDSDVEGDERKSSKNVMYEDFFDPPDYGDEKLMHEEEESFKKPEDDELSFDENAVMSDEAPELSAKEMLSQTSKTTFELEQEKIKKSISNYEDALIKKPEWHLTGEVAAAARPKNSLLHQETEFDVNAKPVLIEDNILNEKVENAIKTIIKNKAFSDGQRKIKPKDITSYKKEILLEQTKSKKSLAAVYEEEYLKKKYGEQEQEDPKHVAIKKMMDSVFPQLQALFCHVPKPAVPDIKIVSHLPAITVEEVAPTSVSDMTLLAPEEVKKKSGLIKGKTERSDTDRKRERRKKKIFQRKQFRETQTEDSKGKPQTLKVKRLEKINTLKKLKQHRNTKMADMEGDKIKSSKDFFSRLQETVNATSQTKKKKKF